MQFFSAVDTDTFSLTLEMETSCVFPGGEPPAHCQVSVGIALALSHSY